MLGPTHCWPLARVARRCSPLSSKWRKNCSHQSLLAPTVSRLAKLDAACWPTLVGQIANILAHCERLNLTPFSSRQLAKRLIKLPHCYLTPCPPPALSAAQNWRSVSDGKSSQRDLSSIQFERSISLQWAIRLASTFLATLILERQLIDTQAASGASCARNNEGPRGGRAAVAGHIDHRRPTWVLGTWKRPPSLREVASWARGSDSSIANVWPSSV